jgi:hypothetical protein
MQAPCLFDMEDLQGVHLQILKDLNMFCKVAWQMSSQRMRRLYMEFELNPLDFSHELHIYNELTDEKIGHSQVVGVLDEMLGIRQFYTDTFTSTRQAGKVLRYASFAACHMGAPANRGDLEWYLRIENNSYADSEGSPLSWLKAFDAGAKRPLLSFLNERLAESIADLHTFKTKNNIPDNITIPPIVFRDEENYWALDHDFLTIRYHFLISLLKLVEQDAVGSS